MKCPYCGFTKSKVLDSRATDEGTTIRRRRMCESCGERFTTLERIDEIQLSVLKRDGTRETFDRAKILNGINRACEKRRITGEQIAEIAADIETSVKNAMRAEVTTGEIGDLVMEKLKALDEVAYVRFASVYRQFKDIDSFLLELNQIMRDKSKKGNEFKEV